MRRRFSKEEKLAAIQQLEKGEAVQVEIEMVRRWRDEFEKFGHQAFSGCGRRRKPIPQKTKVLVFRLRRAEYQRFLNCLESSEAQTVSEFARQQLFAVEPDAQEIENRIASLTEAVKRLIAES
jgi:transposase-like protein